MLAQRAPQFRKGAVHNQSHQTIHHGMSVSSSYLLDFLSHLELEGLVELEELLNGFQVEQDSYSADQLRTVLDSFRDPLMKHLVDEVYVSLSHDVYRGLVLTASI